MYIALLQMYITNDIYTFYTNGLIREKLTFTLTEIICYNLV